LPPQLNPLSSKSVTVLLNNVVIVTININISNFINTAFTNYSTTVTVQTGVNELKFAMSGLSDGNGIFIDNVILQ
jgi:hypothetical protein